MPPTPGRHKSVTFCPRCARGPRPSPPSPPSPSSPSSPSSRDLRYYSDPGRDREPAAAHRRAAPADPDPDLRYYSEPDASNYFEIDYEFLKELRRIARNNCPKCKRKRPRRTDRADPDQPRRDRKQKPRGLRARDAYVYCDGRYHADEEHCQACCRVCNRSTDTLDSVDDDPSSRASRASGGSGRGGRSKSAPRPARERKNSVQSIKSVSFLESSNDEAKDEPNYTAKSFTNDLKKFLLKPSPPRLSLRDKFITSFKQEFEATKKSPKLRAIKGLWKSY